MFGHTCLGDKIFGGGLWETEAEQLDNR